MKIMVNSLTAVVSLILIITIGYFIVRDFYQTPLQITENVETIKIWTDASPGSTAYNQTAIEEIQKLINSCINSEIFLYYGLGSQKIILNKTSNYCNIFILGEIEMGEFGYECNVPITNMKSWGSWKNTELPGSVKEIEDFCRSTK